VSDTPARKLTDDAPARKLTDDAPARKLTDDAPARKLTYVAAFNEGVRQEMAADDDVFVAGEDVGAFGGVFGTFGGLQAQFGERRVVDTPISEQAIVGLGLGAAVSGLRPIVDLMFMDFICVAMDQIVNQAAKLKYMFGGTATVPLTITTAGGAGLSAAAQHSQSLEALLCHIPGLKVVYPSNPYDAKGLITACIREDNPTIFVKHKRLLGMSAVVPEDPYEIPLGVGRIAREGTDVTVVAWGKMANEALVAAERLAGDGISCEVIDPRTLQPLDVDIIVESARRTNRVVVVHEAVRFGGLGAEIAAQIQETAFDHLDAPVARIGAPFSPVPFSPALEAGYVPDADRIVEGIREVLARPLVGS
jgi:pyruvate/2-oxoglutarate/acetoin dehydrogenase E1 component